MVKKKKETILSLLVEIRDVMKAQKPAVVFSMGFTPKSNGRFTTLEDGWVKDGLLGLDWGPSSDKKMTLDEAKKYALNKGGRLPTVEELSRLVDYKRYDPSIDTEFFPDMKTDDWYWTGTEHAYWSDLAWIVDFESGSVYCYCKGNSNYVRPGRPSK